MANTDLLILEARRNGETYLATQLQLAVAADQRAMTLGSILAATSAIVLGLAVDDGSTPQERTLFLLLAVALAVSCALAFFSARPVSISPAGNVPASWYTDLEKDTPLQDALRQDLAVIQRSAEKNSRVLERNAKWLRAAMVVSGAAVIIAPILWVLLP